MYISLLMGVDGAFYLHSATLCYTFLAFFLPIFDEKVYMI